MHRDRHQLAALKSDRHAGRREWGPSESDQHQMEAREHARQHDKGHLTHAQRSAEAERQIRELRGRY